jgi:guanylate kinase
VRTSAKSCCVLSTSSSNPDTVPTRAPGSHSGRACLLVVSGPSGVGKGTVVAALAVARADIEVAVSATTRPPRSGEIDGVHYHFLDDCAFDDLAAADGFLEWATYGGYRYGTPWTSVRAALAEGRTLVLEIDAQGARRVREQFPDAVLVFLLPPSLAVLEARIRERGTDDEATIAQRMVIAHQELAQADVFDHQVVNAQVDQAVAALVRIVDAHCVKRR